MRFSPPFWKLLVSYLVSSHPHRSTPRSQVREPLTHEFTSHPGNVQYFQQEKKKAIPVCSLCPTYRFAPLIPGINLASPIPHTCPIHPNRVGSCYICSGPTHRKSDRERLRKKVFTEDVKCSQSYSVGHGPSFRVST